MSILFRNVLVIGAILGNAYKTSIDIIDPNPILEFDEGVDEILSAYKDSGIPPLVIRSSDFSSYVAELFEKRFGGYDPSNIEHVKLRQRLGADCYLLIVGDGDDDLECVIFPFEFGKGMFESWSSVEER